MQRSPVNPLFKLRMFALCPQKDLIKCKYVIKVITVIRYNCLNADHTIEAENIK